jgi:hypothetical protein
VAAALVDLAILDFPPCVAEWYEDLVFGVIDQDIPISQVKNLWPAVLACAVPSRAPELSANLKSDRSLSGSCGNCEEDAPVSSQDGVPASSV